MTKTNLKTLAYNTIHQKIVTCEYAPGTFLNEEILTSELGLSRTPVRDALSRLEQEGLIEIRPKRGIMVKPLMVSDINMVFEIRMLYEPYILRNYGSAIPESELLSFYDIFLHNDAESDCFRDNDYFYELDTQFHDMIVSACPNHFIRQNYYLVQTQNTRFRYMTGNASNNRLDETFREHIGIVEPCIRKDWEQAAEAMLYHLQCSRKSSFDLVFAGLESGNFRL